MGNLAPVLRTRFFDSNGDPLAGGKLHAFQAGTSTPQATYTTENLATPNANPVILDANGEADVWLDQALSYKFRLDDSTDVTQWTTDDVIGTLASGSVVTASIADLAVTTAKLANDAVDNTKLKDDASTDANRAVTTNHIRNLAVTGPKLAASAIRPGQYVNLKLEAATTSETNDSIKLTGNGAALSADAPGYANVNGTLLTYTADITLDLTGAHWGQGTNGNLTDYLLSAYAIDDAGTGKLGVGSVNGHHVILGADDVTSASSATTVEKIFVNSALTGDSECLELGWVKAGFTDTGGASEDLWVVQTGTGDINHGPRPPIPQVWTPDGTWTNVETVYTGFWVREGAYLSLDVLLVLSAAPTTATLTINIPSGFVIDTALTLSTSAASAIPGKSVILDSGNVNQHSTVGYNSTTVIQPFVLSNDAGTRVGLANITQAAPITFASGDEIGLAGVRVALVGWS